MNLNYDRIKHKLEGEGGNPWTSYSDLFLVLSVVFLLLYVVANIRAGTVSVAQQTRIQQAQKEAEDLRKQIQAYEVLKDDYMQKGASENEIQAYQQLMDQLTLLETESRRERDDMAAKARAADEKHRSLNHYQAMVKNIINANMIASSRVKKRDLIIQEQDRDIEGLNETVQARETEISRNNEKITQIQGNLARQIATVENLYKSRKATKEKYQAEITRLTSESTRQIESLQQANQRSSEELNQTRSRLEDKSREAERLMANLGDRQRQYEKTIGSLRGAHEAALAREKAQFEAEFKSLRLGAEERLARERAYREGIERRNSEYNSRLSGLNSELEKTRGSIRELEGKYQGTVSSLQRANQALQQDLNASLKKLEQQRRLAADMEASFRKAGINASVDAKTGDVMINFEGEYFETDSSNLKPGMRSQLARTFPVYAASLFKDPKIAERISSVEIIGFASPTYQGKSVDPSSLSPTDRAAVNYNMDLSYQRAKSIFSHVFDTTKMQFTEQKRLLPLVKVSGRSYLATDKLNGRKPTSSAKDEYCNIYDCTKSQRVVIKFNLKEE
jgi:hypothetical protein